MDLNLKSFCNSRNKAKLLSHVLNPNKKSKMIQQQKQQQKEEETVKTTKKSSSKRPISKRYVASSSESEDEINDESDHEIIKKKSKKEPSELTTVNMEDLGDLLSKPNMYYAKKSSPRKANYDEDRPITCELCKKTFKKLINLQLHLEKVHEINNKPVLLEQEGIPESFKCSQCAREFVSEEALLKHIGKVYYYHLISKK